jgi:predicted ATPase
LTITGSGGAGKTRLALHVADYLLDSYPDGVWFADLAPLSNAALLGQHVMNLLGIREEAGYLPEHTLMDSFRNKTLLLILDNCEHLLPDVAQFIESLLRNAPGLRILTTSRVKLGLPCETLWRIPSLSSPNIKGMATYEQIKQSEAARLFQDRAAAVRPDFTITRENANVVAQICAHLDGIPLAIELAAARVRVLSVEEILERLNDRFRLLVGSQTALRRQQTLRSLIDWSYDLLTEKERMLMRRLAVFAGSWTMEAAEQIIPGGELEDWEMLDLLTSLIDKSFVYTETLNGHIRYRFLESIQKYSQERLEASQEIDEFTAKHAGYYLNIAQDSYGKMWGSQQAVWLVRLDEEYDNLRKALTWLSQAPGQKAGLLKMAGSLWRYWEIRGDFSEGRAWLELALAEKSDEPDYWRANGLGGAGHLARQQGDYGQAKELHEQSLAIFRAIGSKRGAARQLTALGEIARFQGDYAKAMNLHEQSLAIRYEIQDKEGIAVSLRQLGVIARDRGKYPYARDLLEESLNLNRELGDKLLIAQTLDELGLVAYDLCDEEGAIFRFEEALSLQRQLNDRSGSSTSLQNLGNVAKEQGDFHKAELLYKECLSLEQELGDKRGVARVLAALAEIAALQGKYVQSANLAGQSFELSKELNLKRGMLSALEITGFVAHYQGHYEKAALLAKETLALSIEMEAPRAAGYATMLSALSEYSQGNLREARNKFQQALAIFKKIKDRRSIAHTYINLARTAYRLGDHPAAMYFLNESLATSRELNTRWNMAFVLEIMGLLQRSLGNDERALELFQESLRLSVEQENKQGIANCLGALAGLAVMGNQALRAVRLFAAAARLRREMGAQMSSNDRAEYERYLTMVHEQLDHTTFEMEWLEGFSMATEQILADLDAWLGNLQMVTYPSTQSAAVLDLPRMTA